MLFVGMPLANSSAYIGISVGIAPPPLPVYVQPPCPVPGYIWTPGYWAYSDFGYYWVPGVWVAPPRIGFYWTPGYWGYSGGSYVFNRGYWGPSVGFYGGINYGYGYVGSGYYGGEWAGDTFRYNTAVTRVNTTVIKNVYVNKTVINNNRVRPGGASFNGPKGVNAKPSPQEQAVAEKIDPTPEQQKVTEVAAKNPDFQAKKNGGKPKLAALKTPDEVEKIAPAGGGADAGQDKPGQMAGADAAGADEAGENAGKRRKGGKGNRGADEGDQAAGDMAAGDSPDAAAAGGEATKGRANSQKDRAKNQDDPAAADSKKGGKKAADVTDAGDADATSDRPKAAKGRQQRAEGMPERAATPNLPPAARERGRAQEAITNRGPENRAQQQPMRAGRRSIETARPQGSAARPQRPAATHQQAEGGAKPAKRKGGKADRER